MKRGTRVPLVERSERIATREYSAGGVVTRGGKVLMVRVRNLQGRVLWTLPKGHLEHGETPRQAALREVEEETGFRCRILSSLPVVRYTFTRGGRPVRKQVRWYRMEAEEKVRTHDGDEILAVRWATMAEARRRLVYPGDLKLLELVTER